MILFIKVHLKNNGALFKKDQVDLNGDEVSFETGSPIT